MNWLLDIDWRMVIIQGISVFGMACHISSFQIKKNSHLFFAQLLGSMLFLLHYILLGAATGAIMNLVGVIRGIIFLQGEKLRKPWVLAVLWIMTIVAVWVTWNGSLSFGLNFDMTYWYNIFPLIAMLASSTAMHFNNGKVIRLTQLFLASPGWLTYNIIVFSIGGALCETFIIISTIVSFIRFGVNGFEKGESK